MTTPVEIDPERLGLPSASDNATWSCPGKHNLWKSLGYPKDPEDEYASDGTAIHKAFETGNPLALTPEQDETYQQGLKFLDQILAAWMADRNVEVVADMREERLWVRNAALDPLCSAKLDRIYIGKGGTEALIVDFKTGFNPRLKASSKSTQLRVQAVCLKAEYPDLKHIRVAHCKPKSKYGASDACDYDEQALAESENWLNYWLWWMEQQDAPLVAGEHCYYCPCKTHCPQAGAYSLLPSVIATSGLPDAKKFDADLAVSSMSTPDLVRIWKSKTLVTKIMTAVQDRLKGMTDDDLKAIGLEKGNGKTRREVTAKKQCWDFLIANGWTEEEILGCSKLALPELSKRFAKLQNLSDKKAGEFTRDLLKEFITETEDEAPLKEVKG